MKNYFSSHLLYTAAVIVCVGAVSSVVSAHDPEFSSWEFMRPVAVPEVSESSYVFVPLPADSDLGMNNLRDIRIVADGDRETPFQLMIEDEENVRRLQRSAVVDLSKSADGDLMFILEMHEQGGLHNAVELTFQPAEFRRNVTVFAADERVPHGSGEWRVITDDGYVFSFVDERTGFHVERSRISYPESSARYLRVVVEAGEGGPMELRGASVERRIARDAEETEISRTASVVNNEEDRTTEVVVDLGRSGIPVRGVQFSVSGDGSFHRDIVVQQSDDRDRWRTVSRDSLFRIQTDRFNGERLGVTFPETRSRYLRAVVFNHDDVPLSFNRDVTLLSVSRAVVFQADPGQSYELLYGNAEAQTPRYDLARFFQYLDVYALPRAELGSRADSPYFEPPPEESVPFTERYGYILNIVLVALVLVIGGIVVATVRSRRPVRSDDGFADRGEDGGGYDSGARGSE